MRIPKWWLQRRKLPVWEYLVFNSSTNDYEKVYDRNNVPAQGAAELERNHPHLKVVDWQQT